VLRLDPTLLNDEAYLASYPALRTVLSRYPQIARNPSFYVGESPEHQPTDTRSQAINMWRNTFESISMLSVMLLVAVGLAWLVRTVLDHRRWLRTSRVQTEVQHKLFDRLSTNEDLLTYIQTPAGQRLLDASPGMQDPGPRSVTAPVNRILWSVQIGMVLIPFGLGLQWVGRHLLEEVAQFLWGDGRHHRHRVRHLGCNGIPDLAAARAHPRATVGGCHPPHGTSRVSGRIPLRP
jgi:ABC-type nickel/cobalt efflux system permease component RcnA